MSFNFGHSIPPWQWDKFGMSNSFANPHQLMNPFAQPPIQAMNHLGNPYGLCRPYRPPPVVSVPNRQRPPCQSAAVKSSFPTQKQPLRGPVHTTPMKPAKASPSRPSATTPQVLNVPCSKPNYNPTTRKELYEMCPILWKLSVDKEGRKSFASTFEKLLDRFYETPRIGPDIVVETVAELVKISADKKCVSTAVNKIDFRMFSRLKKLKGEARYRWNVGKIHILWLVGEVLREEYDPYFKSLRESLDAASLFTNFAKKYEHVRSDKHHFRFNIIGIYKHCSLSNVYG